MRIAVCGFVAVVACGSPSKPPPEPPAAAPPVVEAAQVAPVAAPPPKIEKRLLLSEGRHAGSMITTTAADGTITVVYDVLENGRGPHTDAKLVLGPDHTPIAFTATGHHTMGTHVEEKFSRDGAHAAWTSSEETGSGDATAPTFYLPVSDLPTNGWLVTAALAAGGKLALWPGGELRVRQVAEMEVAGRHLIGYEMSGWAFVPNYTWFDRDGSWFGDVDPSSSFVPEGAEAAAAPLAAKQLELDKARAAALAKTAHVPPAAGLAYTHARVLDVERGAWIANQTVVVVGDKITAVGAHAAVPKGAEVVDLAGRALTPGLVDMHSHTGEQDAVLDIASGVTTVRDVGNDPDTLDDMKARFDAGTAVGPHITRMGFIEGRGDKAASSKVTATTPEEAAAAVEFFAKRGYDGIKIYNSVPVALVPLLAADAHKRGMLVIGHIPVHMLAHEAVEAGYDGIEHINMLFLNFLATHDTDTRDTTRFTLVGQGAADLDLDSKPVKDFIQMLAKKQTIIDPTLIAFVSLYLGVPGVVTPGLEGEVARLPVQVQRGFKQDGLPVDAATHARYAKSWTRMLAMVKALWVAKVPVVAGVDGLGGLGLHVELSLLAGAGIPNAEVMKLATIGAARAMRQDKLFGTVAAGKRADLVVLDGDPLADITAVRKVVSTMRSGVVFDPAPLFAAVSVQP